MRVACVQFAPVWGDPAMNRERMRALCPGDADLVIFPEMATSGYLFATLETLRAVAEPAEGPTAKHMGELARRYGCHLVYGFPEIDGERLYNSAALVGPDGLRCVYRKAHLFADEPAFFTPGEAVWPVETVNGVKIGLMICFDWFFPESVRSMALREAELIAHPSNLVLPYCQEAMITRSLENRVFTATCNRIGTETIEGRRYTYTGASQITAPDGRRLVQAPTDADAVVCASIDPSLAREKLAGPGVALFSRRRPELYGTLTEPPE